ncbi:hypothetical protein OK074_8985 [Actinobacteria bacterium OK074]|nr:hypothetical protein OK074_8985 [Actinobacteria bacterium OK074]
MRAIRVASAALLGVTALTFTAPAVADDGGSERGVTSFGFSVLPTTIAAGGQVTLSVKGCDGTVRVSSGVFDTVTIPKGQTTGTAMVDWDAKSGASYDVTFSCGRETARTTLTIATGRTGGTTDRPIPEPVGPGSVQHGVRAGVGGSVGGFDAKEIGLGAALIAGSVGAAWHLSRRRAANGDG